MTRHAVILAALGLLGGTGGCQRSRESPVPPSASRGQVGSKPSSLAKPKPVPLRIAYSDWPGWLAWDIAVENHYFDDADVRVEMVWLEYVPSIEAFSDEKVDAVCMTNGDALVAASSGAPSVGVVLNDYSNGNDMIVAAPGVKRMRDLRGKRIGVEVGFVEHLLLMEALRAASMTEADVDIVNMRTQNTTEELRRGTVQAIASWQPHNGRALAAVPGSRPIFTSADVPGLIYDGLFVSPRSLESRRAEWEKVVSVWFRVAAYVSDPRNARRAAELMARRVDMSAPAYEAIVSGTHFLGARDNQERLTPSDDLRSAQGSSGVVDRFNITNHVYKESVAPRFDRSLVDDAARGEL